MHLLDGARTRFTCIPVVHEVAAGIAVEYFNEANGTGRAFAMVTAGPGVSNIITAMSGAWLESRELLVIAGQVKSQDLATGGVRQRGIQEIDGVINQYKKKFLDLTVVLTGGDANFLSKQLKSSIFANQNFLLQGLNYLLKFNTDK